VSGFGAIIDDGGAFADVAFAGEASAAVVAAITFAAFLA
jgi:hypothetical protein